MSEHAPKSTYLAVGSRERETIQSPVIIDTEEPISLDLATALPSPRVSPESTPTDSTTPTSTETVATTESSPDEAFYTNVEILNNHYPVRRAIKNMGNRRTQAIESVTAHWKNTLDTPGKLRLQLVHSLAKGRLNRKQKKFDAVEHLSDKSWVKRHRLHKLKKAQAKLKSAHNNLEGRKTQMKNRVETVGKNFEQRRTAYRNELLAKRESALARRALRREIRSQGTSWPETIAIVKNLPQAHRERIGKVAATARTSERKATQARKQEKHAISNERRAQKSINNNINYLREVAAEAKRADDTVSELENIRIPRAKESLASLQAERDALPTDDPTRYSIDLQIQQTKERIAIYEKREIPYWNQVANNSRTRIVTLTSNQSMLEQNLAKHQRATRAASARTQATSLIAQAHTGKLSKVITELPDDSTNQ